MAISGNRLYDGETGSGNGTPVLGVPELLGDLPLGHPAWTSMALSTLHENGWLTQPGDVVFCTGSRAAAVVDTEGPPGPEVAAFRTEIETQRARARARREHLEELTRLVLDGVAGGTLTVTDTYAAMEGNSWCPRKQRLPLCRQP